LQRHHLERSEWEDCWPAAGYRAFLGGLKCCQNQVHSGLLVGQLVHEDSFGVITRDPNNVVL
jgi:hypothetical protein